MRELLSRGGPRGGIGSAAERAATRILAQIHGEELRLRVLQVISALSALQRVPIPVSQATSSRRRILEKQNTMRQCYQSFYHFFDQFN